MSRHIAIIEDEPDIGELVALHLQKAGFQVQTYLEARPFLQSLKGRAPELVILDLMLPDSDGLEVCKYMKKTPGLSSVPIIILTARSDEGDKVLGLEMGADDYITKPFSPRELVARVQAVLRRLESRVESRILRIGSDLVLDLDRHGAELRGRRVELTSAEFRILAFLAARPGRVFARQQILDQIWKGEKVVIDRTVDVHIRNIRKKLGEAAGVIKNIRGVGYKIEE
ncbi:MAG: two-component system response regulator [Candidatus Aminicenantes bacterium RBG_13_59_9]|nr:MAG: two-component system response regulator [Candidatus Aminicenantes bacterium RBG_13_59_9]